ncbi:MAG: hypothetical protein CR982_07990 [Candidatus Cloacimonadota bacterium]|nr:MAG: hypothetical protein CR982_07990 [Candidatus Cloacimonadota bacterium]PIE77619.1 MAG: hypothetical protein CSA15_11890 [Candidatus Delongbacteria bacterium]
MNRTIEAIRIIAVILISFTHTRHNFEEGVISTLLNDIPKFGTLILSIVSGYLFIKISYAKKDIMGKKIKSLLIPFLTANLFVIAPVLLLHLLGFDYLNRLSYDYTILTQGLFSLSSPPINPPTYFVRDLFIIFLLIDLFANNNFKTLTILLPVVIFGKLLLRYDILFLFLSGVIFGKHEEKFTFVKTLLTVTLLSIVSFNYFRYYLMFFLFTQVVKIEINFPKTGRYSYLLHLYHSPIIVFTYPIITIFVKNPYMNLVLQLGLTFFIIYLLNKVISRFEKLKFITGGR